MAQINSCFCIQVNGLRSVAMIVIVHAEVEQVFARMSVVLTATAVGKAMLAVQVKLEMRHQITTLVCQK